MIPVDTNLVLRGMRLLSEIPSDFRSRISVRKDDERVVGVHADLMILAFLDEVVRREPIFVEDVRGHVEFAFGQDAP